jgi:hypothetical protein
MSYGKMYNKNNHTVSGNVRIQLEDFHWANINDTPGEQTSWLHGLDDASYWSNIVSERTVESLRFTLQFRKEPDCN